MNRKTLRTLIAIIAIALLLGIGLSVGARKNTPINNQTLCENGDMNSCKLYILEQKREYAILEKQMEETRQNADKARGIIIEQLSWAFILPLE